MWMEVMFCFLVRPNYGLYGFLIRPRISSTVGIRHRWALWSKIMKPNRYSSWTRVCWGLIWFQPKPLHYPEKRIYRHRETSQFLIITGWTLQLLVKTVNHLLQEVIAGHSNCEDLDQKEPNGRITCEDYRINVCHLLARTFFVSAPAFPSWFHRSPLKLPYLQE